APSNCCRVLRCTPVSALSCASSGAHTCGSIQESVCEHEIAPRRLSLAPLPSRPLTLAYSSRVPGRCSPGIRRGYVIRAHELNGDYGSIWIDVTRKRPK